MRLYRKRNCQKGRPCGFTCIDPDEICRKELGYGLSQGLTKVSTEVGKRDAIQSNYESHLGRNNFSLPNTAFSAKDLADAVVQASNQLQGEAKENLRKMMDFVMRDGQGTVVSKSWVSYEKDAMNRGGLNSHSSWVRGPGIDRLMANTAPKFNPLSIAIRLRSDIEKLGVSEARLLKKVEELENRGMDAKAAKNSLLETRKEIRMKKEALRHPDYAIAKWFLAKEGVKGFTTSNHRFVTIISSDDFQKGKIIDASLIRENVAKVLDRRAIPKPLTQDEMIATHNIYGAFEKGNTNERVLATYIHEIGHQIHYRSGIEDIPRQSSTKVIGISGYASQSHRETFAEAFVAFVFNPEALRSRDVVLYNWVKSNFETAMQRAGSSQLVPDF